MTGWDNELPPQDRSDVQEWHAGSGWVRRGRDAPRGHVPYPEAKGILERLQAICREHYAVGDKSFHYPGIEADIAAEEAAAREAHEACYEK